MAQRLTPAQAASLGPSVPNWIVTVNMDVQPLPPGACTPFTVSIRDSSGNSMPLPNQGLLGGSIIGQDQVEASLAGPGTPSFSWWFDRNARLRPGQIPRPLLCATAVAGPDVADIVIRYPGAAADPRYVVPNVAFTATVQASRGAVAGPPFQSPPLTLQRVPPALSVKPARPVITPLPPPP